MKIGIYAGTFNPWHAGHSNILDKAFCIFDKIFITVGENKNKTTNIFKKLNEIYDTENVIINLKRIFYGNPHVEIRTFKGLLVDYIKDLQVDYNIAAVIRGLRNNSDLQYEENMQYWNEDLGLKIPVIYFICDRKLSHLSSSMIRELNEYEK